MSKGDDIDSIIQEGIVWGRGVRTSNPDSKRSKTKTKADITGAHGSGSARQKAKDRAARANRHKNG